MLWAGSFARQNSRGATIDSDPTSWTRQAAFAETRWSVVLAAGDGDNRPAAHQAMGELAQLYWFPLYAFARRQGESRHQAEDLVQAFFAAVMEKRYLAEVDRSKGRFRSFLLAAMKHFMSKERARQKSLKRGGGKTVIALDGLDAEARYALEPATNITPERLFDRRWALAVLDHVLDRLRQEYDHAGKARLYDALEACLTSNSRAIGYAAIARSLGIGEGTARVAAHRLRKRYRDLLRQEIAHTVDSPGQVDEEISYLLSCL